MMFSDTWFYVQNLAVLIEQVERAPVESIHLERYAGTRDGRQIVCPAGMLAQLPYFASFGVRASSSPRGSPCMPGSNGHLLDVAATLDHLFGRFDGHGGSGVLFAPAGAGVWDSVLIGGATEPCNHRELALSRLYAAYEQLTRKSFPAAPAVHADETRAVVQARLVERGWRRRNGTAIADRHYDTAVGVKVALAYFEGPDPFAFALRGDYWSEGSNILAAGGALIPRAACTNTVLQLVDRFAAHADRTIADSYAVRLLRST